jgi:hypothetical protein
MSNVSLMLLNVNLMTELQVPQYSWIEHGEKHANQRCSLAGIGSQFDTDTGPKTETNGAHDLDHANGTFSRCQYHRHILDEAATGMPHNRPTIHQSSVDTAQSLTLQRYLGTGPGEQYALFSRPDGRLSISRECTCIGGEEIVSGNLAGLLHCNET